jgi:hypothetical protein
MDPSKDPAALINDIVVLRKLMMYSKEDIALKPRCPTAESKERTTLIERYGDLKIKMSIDNTGFRKYYIDEWMWGPYKETIKELFFFSLLEANRENSCTCETKHIRKYTTKVIVHREYFKYYDYFDIQMCKGFDVYYEMDSTKNFGLELITGDKKYAFILLNNEDILHKKRPSSKPRLDDMTDIPKLECYDAVYIAIDRSFDKKKITKEIFDEFTVKGCKIIKALDSFIKDRVYRIRRKDPGYFYTFENFKTYYSQFD